MKASLLTLVLFGLATRVQAHVADLPAAQHAGEHAWLSLGLILLLALLLPLVRGRR